mmetsp:Transcript_42569/g.77730  ORF Transcript_42569/g.77730 Transcript_42569/m.77730 type:complete len:200 (+) Transcript_42569:394-993(+)
MRLPLPPRIPQAHRWQALLLAISMSRKGLLLMSSRESLVALLQIVAQAESLNLGPAGLCLVPLMWLKSGIPLGMMPTGPVEAEGAELACLVEASRHPPGAVSMPPSVVSSAPHARAQAAGLRSSGGEEPYGRCRDSLEHARHHLHCTAPRSSRCYFQTLYHQHGALLVETSYHYADLPAQTHAGATLRGLFRCVPAHGW